MTISVVKWERLGVECRQHSPMPFEICSGDFRIESSQVYRAGIVLVWSLNSSTVQQRVPSVAFFFEWSYSQLSHEDIPEFYIRASRAAQLCLPLICFSEHTMEVSQLIERIQQASSEEDLDVIANDVKQEGDHFLLVSALIESRRVIIAQAEANLAKDEVITAKDEVITAQAEAITAQAEVINTTTLVSALTYGSRLTDFSCEAGRGSSSHLTVNATQQEFHITTITEEIPTLLADTTFAEELRKRSSAFVPQANKVSFCEADTQAVVHSILQDAVGICNLLLGITKESSSLYIRREANMISNRPDHSAVYLASREVPVVTIEDKFEEDAITNPRVQGQKFDQLLESVLLTNRCTAIGAITTVKKTCFAWIGGEASKLAQTENLLSEANLRKIKESLPSLEASSSPSTPDPKTVMRHPNPSNVTIEMEHLPPNTRPEKRRRGNKAIRALYVSQEIKAESILHAFCNLIIAGLLLHNPENNVYSLPEGDHEIDFQTCVVLCYNVFPTQVTPPMIDELKTKINGRLTNTTFGMMRFCKFYLVGRLSVGPTFNVFRAVTGDGYECVVKMYIKEYDESGRKIREFEKNGQKAVKDEKEIYHKLYPNLCSYVWTVKLSGRHCLILPFFYEIADNDRNTCIAQIGQVYETKMLAKGYMYNKENVRWRHVGIFQNASNEGEVVLYGLRHLMKGGEGAGVDDLTAILADRCKV